jgi:serine/threonine protein kinase
VAPLGVAHCAEIVHRDLKPANISTSTEEIPLGQKQKLSSIRYLHSRAGSARERFSGMRFGVKAVKSLRRWRRIQGMVLLYSQFLAMHLAPQSCRRSCIVVRFDSAKEKLSWPKMYPITRWAIAQHFSSPM